MDREDVDVLGDPRVEAVDAEGVRPESARELADEARVVALRSLVSGAARETDAPAFVPKKLCPVEETFSADTNEIAIYWNSPAVFAGAYFNSLEG